MTDLESTKKELAAAYLKLDIAEKHLSSMRKEAHRQFKINQILIAAGFLTQDKINEAADILEGLPND